MKTTSQQFYEEALESSGRCKAFIFAASLYGNSDSTFEILAGLAAFYASDAAKWVRLSKQFEEVDPVADGCLRWGMGPDRCLEPHGHVGPCRDASGETTLTLTNRMLGR